MKKRKRSVIVTIVFAMMAFMIAVGVLCALPAKAGEAEGETLEFDLRDGYQSYVMSYDPFPVLFSSYQCGQEGEKLYDLDGDGTPDFKISIWSTYGYSWNNVMTPVPGGSIHGDYVLKPTEGDSFSYQAWWEDSANPVTHTFSSIVFHFPEEPVKAEYSLSGTGVTFFLYEKENGEYVQKEVTKAAPGDLIILLENKKTGQYLKEWKTDSFPKDELAYPIWLGDEDTLHESSAAIRSFIMPAHDVTIEPVYEKQQPYTIHVDGPNDWMTCYGELPTQGQDCFLVSLSNCCYGWNDLDGDGTDDIFIDSYKDRAALGICLFSNLTSYTATAPNDGPYWPVTLSWKKEQTYIVDPASMYYAEVSQKNGKKLYRSLQAYEVKGKTGIFDLDQDGSEDLRFDGRTFTYLSTCSIKDTVTIPAVPEGVNHAVTFVVREIPKDKVCHKMTVIMENEGQYYIGSPDWPLIGDYFFQGEYVYIYPGEGYRFNRININGEGVRLSEDEWERFHTVEIKDCDVVVRIQFRTEDGIVPQPIHTAEAYVIDLSKREYTIPKEDEAIIKPLMELVSEYGITLQDYTIRLSDTADPDSIPQSFMLPEIVESRKHSYDMIQLLLPTSDRTHEITVEGGTIDGYPLALERDTIRIIPEYRSDGYYIHDWDFSDPKDGTWYKVWFYSYENGILEFEMVDRDVHVKGNLEKTISYNVDLSNGKCEYSDELITCIRDALGFAPKDNYTTAFDLDGDGTIDITMNTITRELRVSSEYSCGESYTLEGATRGPYYPIKFVYKPKKEETEVTVTPTPTVEPGDNPNGEPSETGEKPADTAEKKDDSSFHPLYIIIPASIIIFAAATAALMIKRKRDKREKLL